MPSFGDKNPMFKSGITTFNEGVQTSKLVRGSVANEGNSTELSNSIRKLNSKKTNSIFPLNIAVNYPNFDQRGINIKRLNTVIDQLVIKKNTEDGVQNENEPKINLTISLPNENGNKTQ